MLKTVLLAAASAGALVAFPATAQDHSGHQGHAPAPTPAPSPTPAPNEDPSQHGDHAGHGESDASFPDSNVSHPPGGGIPGIAVTRNLPVPGSGTSLLPAAEGGMHGGLHIDAGDWMVMGHGYAWAAYTDQGGPRGGDMTFIQTMAMLSGERRFAGGTTLKLQTMLSLEPAMGAPGYPNLFATGETANGFPLVDRQHPHDLFMELSARIDVPLGGRHRLFLYGGPVGEPALGPSAFMHRRSARYLPQAPITHHWFDSTHITYGVVTLGYSSGPFQIEASAFRGREPDERRWNIETPSLDSWSVRASFAPSPNWVMQVSHGRLKEPEQMHPGQDEARTTASVHYADARLSGTLAFSAKDRLPGGTLIAWLVEANWNPTGPHNLFGRIETVANDELFPDHSHALHDRKSRVTRFEAGYAHRIALTDTLNLALGGSVATYAKPAALDPYYGKSPFSYTLFARLSLGD